jgi:hypothetical protein
VAFFFVVPGCLHGLLAPEQELVEISSFGGLVFLLAYWSIFLGWLLLLLGCRTSTLVVGVLGLILVIALPLAIGDLPKYRSPMYWSWVAAYAILAAGGIQLLVKKNDETTRDPTG